MTVSPELGSATHVVIGATDRDATRAFFEAFGFESDGSDVLVRGLGHHTELVLVDAAPGRRLSAYDLGPRGLDLYTADMDASLAVARELGADVGPVGVMELGPMTMRQVTVWGPDHLPLVLIENTSRRASLLDDHPDELHSEIHSLVWAVTDRDVEARWWETHGATKGMDLAFREAAVSSFMRLPDPEVDVAMVMFANAANDPIRFELLEFPGRSGTPFSADGTAGIQAVGFTVPGAEPYRLTTPGGVVIDVRAS